MPSLKFICHQKRHYICLETNIGTREDAQSNGAFGFKFCKVVNEISLRNVDKFCTFCAKIQLSSLNVTRTESCFWLSLLYCTRIIMHTMVALLNSQKSGVYRNKFAKFRVNQ